MTFRQELLFMYMAFVIIEKVSVTPTHIMWSAYAGLITVCFLIIATIRDIWKTSIGIRKTRLQIKNMKY